MAREWKKSNFSYLFITCLHSFLKILRVRFQALVEPWTLSGGCDGSSHFLQSEHGALNFHPISAAAATFGNSLGRSARARFLYFDVRAVGGESSVGKDFLYVNFSFLHTAALLLTLRFINRAVMTPAFIPY